MPLTLLWYDLETFGRHPQWDRIAQFAAVRTNGDFEEIDEPAVAYCRLTPDYVPHPEACLITGITPQAAHHRVVEPFADPLPVHGAMDTLLERCSVVLVAGVSDMALELSVLAHQVQSAPE